MRLEYLQIQSGLLPTTSHWPDIDTKLLRDSVAQIALLTGPKMPNWRENGRTPTDYWGEGPRYDPRSIYLIMSALPVDKWTLWPFNKFGRIAALDSLMVYHDIWPAHCEF